MINYYIKSKRTPYFFLINLIAHLAIIPAILSGEWWMWILSLIWWQWIGCTAYTTGYHRYYTHKSFKAPLWYDYYFNFFSLFGNPGPVLIWSGTHKLHHKYSDTELDPHSPKHKGFWNVWTSFWGMGVFTIDPPTREDLKDWLEETKDPIAKWFYDNYLSLTVIIMIVLLFMGPWFFIFGFCIPTCLILHGSGIINAFTHKNGKPENKNLVALITAGEGWHLNHHEDPSNYTTRKESYKWWQVDLNGIWINLIKI